VRIRVQSAEVQEVTACLRGDLRIEPGKIGGYEPEPPPDVTRTGWLVRWPEDEDALAGALALAAAYPDLLAGLEIGIAGDVAEAATATLERLGAEGVTHESLPDMLIRPAGESDARPLDELAGELARASRRELHELWIGDDHGDGAASGLLALGGAATQHVALVGDELERVGELTGPLTLVTDAPLIQQIAHALAITAVSRDDSESHLAAADVIAVDGRRPEDLWLAQAAGAQSTVVISHGSRHTAASLRAFGLAPTAVDEPTGTVLATTVI
jgi:hypothetical protein